MAITIDTQPQLFTTLNACIWKVSSPRLTIIAFVVQIIDAETSDVIATKQYATLPMSVQSATFDIAPTLASVVDYQLRHDGIVEESIDRTVKSYILGITEIYLDEEGVRTEGDFLASDQKFIFLAYLSRPKFADFQYNDYVFLQGDPAAKFLSNRPVVSNIYYSGLEYLYLLTGATGKIRLRFYKRSIGLMAEHIIPINFPSVGHRLNLSPAALQAYYGTGLVIGYGLEFTEEYTDVFGTLFTIADIDYYTVQMLSAADAVASELRTYVIKKDECVKKSVQVLFSNNLGGFDSMTLHYPRKVVSSAKTTIKANTLQIDSEGNYYDRRNGVFNQEEVVTSSKSTNAFSFLSDPLSDEMAEFATTLIESDNVYIKLSTGDLFPVSVQAQDYEVKLRRYSTDNNRLSLSFRVSDINFSL